MEIAIIDYGAGNLHSVYKAVNFVSKEFSNAVINVTKNIDIIKESSHIILPGVGSFNDCMNGLNSLGDSLISFLKNDIVIENRPFLGICVGMQMLASIGYEHGQHQGLDIIKGSVKEIKSDLEGEYKNLKIPHMGWNNIHIVNESHPIVEGIKDNDHVYFVHSYYFADIDPKFVLADCDYGIKIPAIIAKNNIIATQFHPEKSGECGLNILRNFLNIS